jgi:hypothetical protein
VGPQLAGALLFIAISSTFYAALADAVPGLDSSSPQLRREVSPLNQVPDDVDPQIAAAADDASTDAFHVAMAAAAAMCFGGAAVNGIGIINPIKRSEGPAEGDAAVKLEEAPTA